MRMAHRLACLFLLLSATALFAADPSYKSTADEQVGVEVTVYNNDIGLVKDTRKLNLAKGQGELRFMDVAASIMPPTVHVKSLSAPELFSVLSKITNTT